MAGARRARTGATLRRGWLTSDSRVFWRCSASLRNRNNSNRNTSNRRRNRKASKYPRNDLPFRQYRDRPILPIVQNCARIDTERRVNRSGHVSRRIARRGRVGGVLVGGADDLPAARASPCKEDRA